MQAFVEKEIIPRIPTLRSLVVADDCSVIYQHHVKGVDPNYPVNVKSIAKSVLSAAIGVLIREGLVKELNQPIGPFLPLHMTGWIKGAKRLITIAHLLTMTSGIDWLENGHMTRYWLESECPSMFALRLPVLQRPGTKFKYSNFSVQLLSLLVSNVAGTTLAAFAEKHLFQPLEIHGATWHALADGYTDGSSNLWLRPLDLVRFGRLYLHHGNVKGYPLIPSWYIHQSSRRLVDGGGPERTGYGYLWWVNDHCQPTGFFASGYGGQRLQVLPSQNLLIVITADPDVPRDRLPDSKGATDRLGAFLCG